MPLAGEVAAELRRIADALDREPEAEVKRPLCFFYPGAKEEFLTLARLLPRPLAKKNADLDSEYPKYILEHQHDAVWLKVQIDQSRVCTLISPAIPAKFKCEPLLSEEEESTLA